MNKSKLLSYIKTIIMLVICDISYCIVMSIITGVYSLSSLEFKQGFLDFLTSIHLNEERLPYLKVININDIGHLIYAIGYEVCIITNIVVIIVLIFKPEKIKIEKSILGFNTIGNIIFTLLCLSIAVYIQGIIPNLDINIINKIQSIHLLPPYRWIILWAPDSIYLRAFNTGIVTPILEELLFRYRFNNLVKPLGEVKALIITSVLFASVHTEVNNTLMHFLIGLILGIILYITGNIIYCIIVHSALNFVIVIFVNTNFIYRDFLFITCCSIFIFLIIFLLYIFISKLVERSNKEFKVSEDKYIGE